MKWLMIRKKSYVLLIIVSLFNKFYNNFLNIRFSKIFGNFLVFSYAFFIFLIFLECSRKLTKNKEKYIQILENFRNLKIHQNY